MVSLILFVESTLIDLQSLFVFFNHKKAMIWSLNFLYQKQYLNAIQDTCPCILMYLSNAIVINKSSRRNVKLDLVKVIQEESYTITDTAKRAHVMLRIQISPKCSQTYHSPELLQVHFKHFHDQDTPIIQSTVVDDQKLRVYFNVLRILPSDLYAIYHLLHSNIAEENFALMNWT